MTANEIITLTWKILGEPTDLNPSTATGLAYLLNIINQAQRAVAMWKDDVRMRQFRYRKFQKEFFQQVSVVSNNPAAGSTVSTLVINGTDYTNFGETDLAGMVVMVNDEYRTVMTNTGVTLTVDEDFTTAPAITDTYYLYPKWIYLAQDTAYVEILKVQDLDTEVELQKAIKEDTFLNDIREVGDPNYYYHVGRRIYFDIAPENTRWFRMFKFVLPADLALLTDIPELPPSIHHGIVLYAVHLGYKWMQEPQSAYAAFQDFTKFMRTTRDEWDVVNDMNQSLTNTVRIK